MVVVILVLVIINVVVLVLIMINVIVVVLIVSRRCIPQMEEFHFQFSKGGTFHWI